MSARARRIDRPLAIREATRQAMRHRRKGASRQRSRASRCSPKSRVSVRRLARSRRPTLRRSQRGHPQCRESGGGDPSAGSDARAGALRPEARKAALSSPALDREWPRWCPRLYCRERASACQHLVEHAAERPNIGTLVDRLAACLLGLMYAPVPRITPSCVGSASANLSCASPMDRSWRRLRQAEIQWLY